MINKSKRTPVLTEYCNICRWHGTQADTIMSFTEEGHVVIKCPKCENDISYNLLGENRKQSIGAAFIGNFIGGFFIFLVYLIIQAFLLTVWIVTAGRAESPLTFHRDVMKVLKNMHKTY